MGRGKASGTFNIKAIDEEDFNAQLEHEFRKHLISEEVWFEKGKIFAGMHEVGNFEFIARDKDKLKKL